MDASPEACSSDFGRLLPVGLFRLSVGKALLIFLGILPGIVFSRTSKPSLLMFLSWTTGSLFLSWKAKSGTLTFQDLFAPHDEQRLLVPRIIITASMFATGPRYRMQSYITFIVVATTSACLLWLGQELAAEDRSTALLLQTFRTAPEEFQRMA